MRRDELYNAGGFDPDHPSGNVLDQFEHHGGCTSRVIDGIERLVCTCKPKDVRVKHYDTDGSVIEDRVLDKNEHEFFFPAVGEGPAPAHAAAVNEIADERTRVRIEGENP